MERLTVRPSSAMRALPPSPRVARPSWAALALALALLGRAGPLAAQQAAPAPLSTREIAARATPATVTIVTFDAAGDTLAQGSGFFVRSSGVVLTNWHVMQGADHAVVLRPNGEQFTRVRFLDGDSAIDLALLKVPGYDLPVLTTRADAPAVGEPLVTIGSPLGLAQTVTEGIVSADRLVDGRELIQISAPISHGSSGGAVLDQTGRVFAVSTAQLATGQALNFAVPVRYALGLLAESPTERSLASVFGGNAHGTGAATATAPAPTARPSPAPAGTLPARAAIVRPTMDGIWVGRENATDAHRLVSLGEVLFIAHGEGFMTYAVYLPGDTLADRWYVTFLQDARVAPDGQAAFSLASMNYNGYETDSGFALSATWTKGFAQPVQSTVVYTATALPLTNNAGPYDVTQCRTWFYDASGNQASAPVDWTGALVAALLPDSVEIVLALRNDAGGTTNLLGKSPLGPDGAFDIVADNQTRLTGTLQHGTITATWTDWRDGGFFYRGTLQATRR